MKNLMTCPISMTKEKEKKRYNYLSFCVIFCQNYLHLSITRSKEKPRLYFLF